MDSRIDLLRDQHIAHALYHKHAQPRLSMNGFFGVKIYWRSARFNNLPLGFLGKGLSLKNISSGTL